MVGAISTHCESRLGPSQPTMTPGWANPPPLGQSSPPVSHGWAHHDSRLGPSPPTVSHGWDFFTLSYCIFISILLQIYNYSLGVIIKFLTSDLKSPQNSGMDNI